MKREYLDHELSRLKQFFTEHREFYKYCRTCSTHMDNKYFVRGQYDVHLLHDSFFFETDPGFSTYYDFLVSQITANTRLLTYIEKLLLQSDGSTSGRPSADSSKAPSLTWTGNKIDLVELIYALHLTEVFNNGKADLKLIATCLQQVFDIDLGNYCNIFQDMRRRKTGQTKFLDHMKGMLTKKLDEIE